MACILTNYYHLPPESTTTGFSFSQVPLQNKCRWFVKHGATTRYDRGFRSKAEADAWITAFGEAMDWRAGYVFRLKGLNADISVVDRQGQLAKP